MVHYVQPRQVAVAIPYRVSSTSGDPEICLVSSRKHDGKLVLPKGGIENGETSVQAAIREMWEEAGLKTSPKNLKDLPSIGPVGDEKAHKKSPIEDSKAAAFVPRAIYTGHAVPVDEEFSEWPEKNERQRTWLPATEVYERIAWRKDIAEIFKKSDFFTTKR